MKALLLLSGGIDSPVAGYLMKNKLDLIAIHFDNQPFTDEKSLEKTKKLAKKIGIKKLYIIQHGKNQAEIIKNTNRKFQCILCRRIMFRVSEAIAKKESCKFLVTGENLGQVASQTLSNMATTDSAVKIPILRPLLCNDKVETMAIARKIDTYETSILPGMCCNMVPQNPATKSNLSFIENEESRINIKKIIDDSVKNCEILTI